METLKDILLLIIVILILGILGFFSVNYWLIKNY